MQDRHLAVVVLENCHKMPSVATRDLAEVLEVLDNYYDRMAP